MSTSSTTHGKEFYVSNHWMNGKVKAEGLESDLTVFCQETEEYFQYFPWGPLRHF
ncbi:MAG: hypothetical protein ACJ0DI_10995 [bacterium]